MNNIVIAGIGTDVGKTVVSAIVVEALKADYWKPIQAGELSKSDTSIVKSLVSNDISKFHREAYQLNSAMSPHAAADIDHVRIAESQLLIPKSTRPVVIELAGGLMVPINESLLNIDLIRMWNAPVILVSNYYLGSINHTLLSVELLRRNNINILGLVMNGDTVESTKKIIFQHSELPCLLELAHEKTIDHNTIKRYAKRFSI